MIFQGAINSGFWVCFFVVVLGGVCAELSSLNIYDYDAVIVDKIDNVDWNDNFTYILCETMCSVLDKAASQPVTRWQIKRLLLKDKWIHFPRKKVPNSFPFVLI